MIEMRFVTYGLSITLGILVLIQSTNYAFSISNVFTNTKEAVATTQAAPPSNNTNTYTNTTLNDTGIGDSAIVHVVRFTLKPDAPKDQVDLAFEQLRKQGREIPAVQFFIVGRDFGGEFDYGAIYVMKDIEGYMEYMMSPIHRKSDEIGLPLVDKFISMDITDDKDPAIGDKIAEIHRDRFANDPALVKLIESLGSYEGSGTGNSTMMSGNRTAGNTTGG
jgi:Stress responsive A/B Barrel Domain